jgi:hypothetical protein
LTQTTLNCSKRCNGKKNTRGVQYFKPYEIQSEEEILDKDLMVYFNTTQNSNKWINYITRKMSGVDENILFEMMQNTASQPQRTINCTSHVGLHDQ